MNATDQAAQNIAAAHLSKPCSFMPDEMQYQLESERHKKGASKAGQNYWVKACDVGVMVMVVVVMVLLLQNHSHHLTWFFCHVVSLLAYYIPMT
jgi:Flp pilus assembly protein TadB